MPITDVDKGLQFIEIEKRSVGDLHTASLVFVLVVLAAEHVSLMLMLTDERLTKLCCCIEVLALFHVIEGCFCLTAMQRYNAKS